MSPKQLKLIAVALLVLVVLWGASALLHRRSDTLGGYSAPALTAGAVDSVVIAGPTDTTWLTKNPDGAWQVNGYRASLDLVNEFLKDLSDTASAELVAQNPSSFRRLGVDSAGAHVVRAVASGKTVLEVNVGNMGNGYSSAYVRRPGRDEVYLVAQPLHGLATRDINGWRDKTIVRVPRDSAARIEVRTGRHAYAIQKHDSAWAFVGGGAVDSTAIERLLGDLGDVTATGFASPAERDSANFTRPDRTVVVKDASGGTLADLALDSTSYAYWVRSEGDSVIYKIGSTLGRAITPADSTMRAHAAAKPPAANAARAPTTKKK